MRRRLVAGSALLALCCAPAARAGDAAKFQRGSDFQKRVDAAIAKGVAWLRSVQKKDGGFADEGVTWSGGPAFAYLALRSCKVPADDPAALLAFQAMRRKYLAHRPKSDDEIATDEAGTFCMALAVHGTPTGGRDASGEQSYVLSADDAAWMKELVKFLEEMQKPDGSFAYAREMKRDKDADSGESQRALLGLKAASRAGVHAKTETWSRAMQAFFDVQEKSGPAIPRDPAAKNPKSVVDHARGFGAPREKRSELSVFDWNTADGAACVVICRGELSPDAKHVHSSDAKAEQSIRDAIAWLGRDLDDTSTFDVRKSLAGGVDQADYVVAYSMERAGDLAGAERMGGHDWYGEGATWLLAMQDAAGSWGAEHVRRGEKRMGDAEMIEATCSALLFLSRSTPNGGRGALTRPLDDTDINFGVASSLLAKDFEDFVDLVLSRWRKGDADVKERLASKTTAVGPRVVAPLVKRLASAKDDERAAAFAVLKRATGLDHGYDPAAPEDARATALAAWNDWLAANDAKLRYDPLTQKIVVGP